MKQPQAQCVIFDCDGTLIDSERLCCQALCETFHQFGASLSMEEAIRHFEGGKLADILSATKQRLGVDISIDQLEPLYRARVDRLFEEGLQPMEGVFDLLAYLNDSKVEYCVASNGPRDKIERSLELTGLLPYFDGKIFSAFDTNSWKPEPDLIMYSAMIMGFKLEDCLYVDDTTKGVEAGLRAGVRTIQLSGLNNKHHTLDLKIIKHLKELETFI
ncbi:HAD family hydrolase [Vibrio galatheae]|uniref:HAD family hydrolase n=1 Tax=Vibrio galatheae TaxID=579748 RepID=A0A0F4NLT3_9VIBR|nr:HAD-IA family hydrolase [Vibrio galatheae]KJY83839.1 HAD family hydrolase [Vibrio galatheae]